MRQRIDLSKPINCYKCINLGCGHRGVPEQFLNDTNVGTAFEQVGCKRVTQAVGRNFGFNARSHCCLVHDLPSALTAQSTAAVVQEKCGR